MDFCALCREAMRLCGREREDRIARMVDEMA